VANTNFQSLIFGKLIITEVNKIKLELKLISIVNYYDDKR